MWKQWSNAYARVSPSSRSGKSSTGKYTFSGGDLGWRKLDDLPSMFSNVAPGLATGETADPIRSDSGFHIVYMAEKRGGRPDDSTDRGAPYPDQAL